MYRYREPAICRHIKAILEKHGPLFCNHYSYKFDFVNYLRVLGFTVREGKPPLELTEYGGVLK